ncbi:DUF2339 domain-containing protein [Sphingomonas sp. M1-B02]|uniref:DUF2339 domain-containing protein n=1 Tax=Sphingomonas sp. M1-B02 TaxID=3114300 RepID=UPI00223FE962|nr:DUF2339 domain-containing protein [Sphingomonas sp. S6-11]UZK64958.1 DUF2339 domain-containing protein [Sphingomonas sp. S6-11]
MEALILLLILGGAVAFQRVLRRIGLLEAELRRLESRLERSDARASSEAPERDTAAATARIVARAVITAEEDTAAAPTEKAIAPPPPPIPSQPEPRLNLESLIGGRLPIWIGGAALVLAGIFLVRYSIESGLLGPGTRTVLAALFGVALVAASEAARRFPATAEDPRVAQVLAGAGIASLYGTLYMAAALYDLVTPLPAFMLVLLVTGAAMALALRHGPPTAVMALVGGFAAPLVAGFDAAGIGPLLVYLALFITALFGLAVHRGWGWLALAASVAGFGWINFLVASLDGRPQDLSAVGAFTMLLAACASVALPATGTRNPWLRLAPLVAGFVQLVALAPALEFGALAWSFYLVLAAAALFLAWRDNLYLPAALAALGFLLLLEALALIQPERSATPIAAILATLLFAVPGQLFAPRDRRWSILALGGSAGPLLVAHACAPSLLDPLAWGLLELIAAAACARLAWLDRARTDAAPAPASAAAALLATVGLAQFLPGAWIAVPLSLAIVALAAWARSAASPRLFLLPAFPYLAALVAAALPLVTLGDLILASTTGDRLPYLRLPALGDFFRGLALPTAALLFILLDPRMLAGARRLVGGIGIGIAILLLYALAKQPLAIADLPRFGEWGFVERALLTQACLAAGWLMLRRGLLPTFAGILLTLGLARLVWFDLLILSPVLVPQAVGSLPLLNAFVLHLALAAFWLWALGPARPIRAGAALLTIAAALAFVRQAAHGSIVTGPVGTGENGGYSAILLGVALFWLWRGISAARHDLRVAGLVLLTLVTFKVFLIDAAALDGILRILSFLGLGVALIGIGWAYNRFLGKTATPAR